LLLSTSSPSYPSSYPSSVGAAVVIGAAVVVVPVPLVVVGAAVALVVVGAGVVEEGYVVGSGDGVGVIGSG
jgi:hypothetical protein